ncbi:caspase domain-containing protein [Lewinella sp. LCG006]|uniref:caspase family protein n=1 Tax=Lewinella sp. LCG006 TaxID=3231911 RepID=UPI003460F1C5
MTKERPVGVIKGFGRSVLSQKHRMQQAGKTFFLGIGINTYNNGWPPLRNAVRDVKTIAEILEKDYGVQQLQLLLDEDATRENILRALDDLADSISAPDSLIVYYAGHGHLNKRERGFWVPHDAKANELGALIPNTTLRDHLHDIKTLHTLLISDACFSGSLLVRSKDNMGGLAISELAQLPSRWAICSGRHDEVVADGPANGHSPFAQSILDVLQKTEEPFFTTDHLYIQVRNQTRANYDQLPDGGVLMGIGHGRGMYVFTKKLNEQLAWEEALQVNTVAAYEHFVHLFPEGKKVEQAKATLLRLNAEAAWQKISHLPDTNLAEVKAKSNQLLRFCEQYPRSIHYQTAIRLGENLDAKREYLRAYNSIFKLMKLAEERGPYLSNIEERLKELKAQRVQEQEATDAIQVAPSVPIEKKVRPQWSTLKFKGGLPLLYEEKERRPLKIVKSGKDGFYVLKQFIELPLANTKTDFIDGQNKPVKASVLGTRHFINLQIVPQPLSEGQLSLVAKGKALRYQVSLKSIVGQAYKHIYALEDSSTEKYQIDLEKGTQQLLNLPAGYPVLIKEKTIFASLLALDYRRIMLVVFLGVFLAVTVKYLTDKAFTPRGSTPTGLQFDTLSATPPYKSEPSPVREPLELSAEDKVLYEEARSYRITARAELNTKTYDGVRKIFDRVKIENYISQLGGIASPPREVTKLIEELFEINNDYFQNGYSKKEYELIIHKVKVNTKTGKPETATDIAAQRKITLAEIIKYNPRELDQKGRILRNPDGSLPTLVIYRKLD